MFGTDIYSAGIGKRIEEYFRKMITGPGAVRRALQKVLQ
jgi:fructuronate reductase